MGKQKSNIMRSLRRTFVNNESGGFKIGGLRLTELSLFFVIFTAIFVAFIFFIP